MSISIMLKTNTNITLKENYIHIFVANLDKYFIKCDEPLTTKIIEIHLPNRRKASWIGNLKRQEENQRKWKIDNLFVVFLYCCCAWHLSDIIYLCLCRSSFTFHQNDTFEKQSTIIATANANIQQHYTRNEGKKTSHSFWL